MSTLLFIGLGHIGYPLAGHLYQAGHRVSVYNRSIAKAQRWQQEYSGQALSSLDTVDADVIFTCVGNDNDLDQLYGEGQGLFAALTKSSHKPALIIDHSTVSPAMTRKWADQINKLGIHYADAPVSGGQEGAQKAQLTLMVGSAAEVYQQVVDITKPYTATIARFGDVGQGQTVKMVNQVCAAGVIQGLAEGLALAQANQIDINTLLSVLSQGAAASWQMQHRGQTMTQNQFDFGFAVKWMIKDLNIVMDQARQDGLSLPATAAVLTRYQQLASRGYAEQDTSCLIKAVDLTHAER